MEFFIMLWIFFAILCGVIADKKGRSAIGWGFAGFMFSFFAFFILLALDPLPKPGQSNS